MAVGCDGLVCEVTDRKTSCVWLRAAKMSVCGPQPHVSFRCSPSLHTMCFTALHGKLSKHEQLRGLHPCRFAPLHQTGVHATSGLPRVISPHTRAASRPFTTHMCSRADLHLISGLLHSPLPEIRHVYGMKIHNTVHMSMLTRTLAVLKPFTLHSSIPLARASNFDTLHSRSGLFRSISLHTRTCVTALHTTHDG